MGIRTALVILAMAVIALIALIPRLTHPDTAIGQMSETFAQQLLAGGVGMRTLSDVVGGKPQQAQAAGTHSDTPSSVAPRWTGTNDRLGMRIDVMDITPDGTGGKVISFIVNNTGSADVSIALSMFTVIVNDGAQRFQSTDAASTTISPHSSLPVSLTIPTLSDQIDLLIATSQGSMQVSLRPSAAQQASGTGAAPPAPDAAQDGDLPVVGGPTVTADQIDAILKGMGSPAAGTGASWIAAGQAVGIDPAFAVAFFIHESSAGTNAQWAGIKADGSTTHNVGNIICAGYPTCYGRFRDYGSWDTGITEWFHLIDTEYVHGAALHGNNLTTLRDIISIYAPSSENDVEAYIGSVAGMVRKWRAANAPAAKAVEGVGTTSGTAPYGDPLRSTATVITQGYGVGTHSPAATWGAVDLAIDGNGDGVADSDATMRHPIYATQDGAARVALNSVPAGNHVWVEGAAYRTGYSHLDTVKVADGATVHQGDVIGYVGMTGQASGPHLDYQVWKMGDGAWVNQNPMEYGVTDHIVK
jgi:murein DD-endopeptidase MepM/ murein hydrolase activator NlpD